MKRVVSQTNLTCGLDWVQSANRETFALWCTYPPIQTSRAEFLASRHRLAGWGIRSSVGVVGLRTNLEEIEALRANLPDGIYLWVNADKKSSPPLSDAELDRLTTVDAFFLENTSRHPSFGPSADTLSRNNSRSCRT